MAVCFIVIFLGLWVPAVHWLYDASFIVGTLFTMLLYYTLMKVGDKEFFAAKAAAHAQALADEAEEAKAEVKAEA